VVHKQAESGPHENAAKNRIFSLRNVLEAFKRDVETQSVLSDFHDYLDPALPKLGFWFLD